MAPSISTAHFRRASSHPTFAHLSTSHFLCQKLSRLNWLRPCYARVWQHILHLCTMAQVLKRRSVPSACMFEPILFTQYHIYIILNLIVGSHHTHGFDSLWIHCTSARCVLYSVVISWFYCKIYVSDGVDITTDRVQTEHVTRMIFGHYTDTNLI